MPEILVGGHVVARQLKNEGVRCVFTLCGGHVAPIYDGCLREGIDIIDTRHEQAAVHAADGWARLHAHRRGGDRHRRPGVTDGVTGWPTRSRRSSRSSFWRRGRAPLHRQEARSRRWSRPRSSVRSPRRLHRLGSTPPRRVHRTAFRIATSGRPGPVFVELPFDVLTAQVQDPYFPPAPSRLAAPAGDPTRSRRAAQLVARPQPIALRRLAGLVGRRGRARCAASPSGQHARLHQRDGARLAPARPPALLLAWRARTAFRAADLVIVVGTPLDFRVGYGAGINARARIVQIDRDPTRIGAEPRGARGAPRRRALDPRPAHRRGSMPPSRPRGSTSCASRSARRTPRSRPTRRPTAARSTTTAWRSAIADAIDPDTILIGDGGDCVALAARVIPSPARPVARPGPLGCLGVGAAFALAAKKLHPRRKVLVLSGDGSFG
jgi:acetolactate synthase-1/2/3 large subunit